jgi:hypothetical protein
MDQDRNSSRILHHQYESSIEQLHHALCHIVPSDDQFRYVLNVVLTPRDGTGRLRGVVLPVRSCSTLDAKPDTIARPGFDRIMPR